MAKLDKNKLSDASYGAAALLSKGQALPSVFPRQMGTNTMAYLREVVDSGLTSDMVSRFEQTLAEAHGRQYAVAAPGCTAALFALFSGLDFEPGDEIIVSPIADYGDLCGLLFENYVPVFCDVEPDTGLVSARTIEPCITSRTRAILAVNFFGLPCEFDPIVQLAEKHDLLVIEDVCQSVLATYKGRLAGSLGHVSAFSFDSEKTCGADMGGALLLDDKALYERIVNRAHARGAKAVPGFGRKHFVQGIAMRMPMCTAATCLANWEMLPEQVEQRQLMAALLDELLADIPGISIYRVPTDRTHSYWLYGFHVDASQFRCSPSELGTQLSETGVSGCGTAPYYVLPAACPFLSDYVAQEHYPFSTPPASRSVPYHPEQVCPNAVSLMDSFIRWFWTEKYQPSHIEQIGSMVRDVCQSNYR